MGSPKSSKILKNPKKSLPKCPLGVLGADSKKTSKIDDFRVPRNLENEAPACAGDQFSLLPLDQKKVPKSKKCKI